MQIFTRTSDEPYDHHDYKLIHKDGKTLIFDNYQDLQEYWWKTPQDLLEHVEILDKKQKKTKGFGV